MLHPHSSSVETQCCCDELPFHHLLLQDVTAVLVVTEF